MIGRKISHYSVKEKLGAGGMGEVYRASDTKLNRDVALKVLPEEFARDADRMARFKREAQVLASLNHPNIAAIYGLEESDGIRCLVLELVEGPTLAERIGQGSLPLKEALGIARQIAEALEAAHEKGIIHRDLKPANVKVTPEGTVKVLDFGLAKALEDDPSSVDISKSPTLSVAATQAGVILGTAAYMSPEQAHGRTVDRRADIWSFGVVLYEMLTGRQLFIGESISDTLAAVLRAEVEWDALPAGLPAGIRHLLRRCLTRDRKQRLQAIGDARLEIEEVLAGAKEERPITAPAPMLRWKRALPWALAAAFAVVAGFSLWNAATTGRPGEKAKIRFAVTFPKERGLRLQDVPILAISRDGKSLAYMGHGENGPLLYLRALDQIEPRPIPGTERASHPFFSPDGQWVGFFADGELKKVSLRGGTPLTLAEAGNHRGASWGLDNWIVFSPEYSSPLLRIPAAGGEAETLTILDESREDRTHRWPDVLPNGKGVVFTIGSMRSPGDYDDADIAVHSFETAEARILLTGGSMPRYVSTGHIVYVRAGVLYGVGFDADRLELTGQPFPVLEGVAGDPSSGAGYFAVAIDGTLAHVPGQMMTGDRLVVITDREGNATPLPLPPDQYGTPRFSPDGKRLALGVGSTQGGESDIWIYDFTTGRLNRLTFEKNNAFPSWMRDGKSVAYGSSRGGVKWGFYSRLVDGSGEEQLLLNTDPVPHFPESWTPDGKALIVTKSTSTTGIYRIELSDEVEQEIVAGGAQGRLSPDGRWLAYTSAETGVENRIYVQAFPGPGGKWQITTVESSYPVWSGDGKKLYFTLEGQLAEVDVQTEPIFRAGTPRILFGGLMGKYIYRTAPQVNYDVSPDGRKFAFIQASSESTSPQEIHLTLSWFDDLHRLAPTGKK